MPYQPVEMEHLVTATKSLDRYFSSFSKRYVPRALDDLCRDILGQKEDASKKIPKINDLKAEYEAALRRKSGFFSSRKPDSVRLAQIACIRQTAEEVLRTKVPGEEWKELAHQIILGSIIYRLLRIDNNYSGIVVQTLWGSAEDKSGLQVCLLRLLGINSKKDLDIRTIISTCTAYQSYLLKGRVKEGYSYIQDNPLYLPGLEDLIASKKQKIPHSLVVCETQIEFIKSFPSVLQGFEEAVGAACEKWAPVLTRRLAELGNMDKARLVASLAEIQAHPVAFALIKAIIPSDVELKPGSEVQAMFTQLKTYLGTYYHFALLGAYVISLNKSPELPVYFAQTLNFAIKSTEDNTLDDNARKLALTALQWILDAVPDIAINVNVWGGLDRLKAELLVQVSTLLNKKDQPAEPLEEPLASLAL